VLTRAAAETLQTQLDPAGRASADAPAGGAEENTQEEEAA
jgi:hypothetical protein